LYSIKSKKYQVLREHRETVHNCLESFVHDPLVEWTNRHSKTNTNTSKSASAMKAIAKRLMGRIGDSSLPISVQGYVQHLIGEATSNENLGRMFVGWMPWL
jgi:phosphatidylinositol kinase/protein kinase (PI-3  family)